MLSSIAQNIPPRHEAVTREGATKARLAQAGADGVEVVGGRQRIVAAPLDRLLKEGKITSREFDAGDKYRGDAYMAAIDPSAGTVDWNRAGGGGAGSRVPSVFSSQMIADARHRVRDLEQKIPHKSAVSTLLYLGLIREHDFVQIGQSVFGYRDPKDAVVAAKAGLRTALASLADVYGN